MELADVGVNFKSKNFKYTCDEIINHASGEGVKIFIAISNSTEEIKFNLDLCSNHRGVYCTVGVHPHNAKTLNDSTFNTMHDFIKSNIGSKKIVAIGECGLDYDRMFSTKEDQVHWFSKQLDLAAKFNLPVYLHSRGAHEDFMNVISSSPHNFSGKAVVHCFTGNYTELVQYISAGFFIGITGWITDNKRNSDLLEALVKISADPDLSTKFLKRVMIETDSPWLRQRNIKKRGTVNYPENVYFVALKLADIMKMDVDEIAQITFDNTKKFFGL
jgi:TatD DNase family protein